MNADAENKVRPVVPGQLSQVETRRKPDYLYKYLSLRPSYAETTLSESSLWFSCPNGFSDPFDCKAFFDFSAGTQEDRSELYEHGIRWLVENDKEFTESRFDELGQKYRHKYPTLEAAARFVLNEELYECANLKNLGVLCLSETGTDPIMFSHYSDDHAGICVQFSVDDRSFFARAEAVTYDVKYPALNFFKSEPEDRRRLFLTKYDGWQYEKEWRVLDFKDGYGLRSYPDQLLTGVIFGIKTSEKQKKRVNRWLRRRGHRVKLFQGRAEPGIYKLNLEMLGEVGP